MASRTSSTEPPQVMLSIITPVFNGFRFLPGAIENVIAQRVDGVEHVIVDGGSTDGSVDILRDYASRYSHIRWISEQDRGQSDAMNKGLRLARGEFVSFLNADDFYEPGVFRRILQLIDQADPAVRSRLFLLGNTRVADEKGDLIWMNRPRLWRPWMLTGMNFRQYPVNPSAYFYHRSLHDRVGLYSDKHQFGHMDLEFVLRALPVMHLRYFDEHWGNFREYPGTITAKLYASGEAERKVMETLRSFHDGLPLRQRFWVMPMFRFANSRAYMVVLGFLYRAKFVLENPRDAARRAREILTGTGRRFGER